MKFFSFFNNASRVTPTQIPIVYIFFKSISSEICINGTDFAIISSLMPAGRHSCCCPSLLFSPLLMSYPTCDTIYEEVWDNFAEVFTNGILFKLSGFFKIPH